MLLLAHVLDGVGQVLDWVLQIYWWILIARAVISWVNADPRNPIVSFLHAATDPPLRVIRRRLPTSLRYFPLDVAFLVLLGLVVFAQYGLVPMLLDYAALLRRQSLGAGVLSGGRRMKLSPMDIQRQAFDRRLRGFDPDEVRTYLAVVAEEMAAPAARAGTSSSSRCGTSSRSWASTASARRSSRTPCSPRRRPPRTSARARARKRETVVMQAELQGDRLLELAQERAHEVERGILELRAHRSAPAHRRARADHAADAAPRPAGGGRARGQPALPEAPRGGRRAGSDGARPARHGRRA